MKAAIIETEAETAAALVEMQNVKVSPAQHIRNMDHFFALNREVFAEQQARFWQLATRPGTEPAPTVISPAARHEHLPQEIRQILDGKNPQSPSARIAAIDAIMPLLRPPVRKPVKLPE